MSTIFASCPFQLCCVFLRFVVIEISKTKGRRTKFVIEEKKNNFPLIMMERVRINFIVRGEKVSISC